MLKLEHMMVQRHITIIIDGSKLPLFLIAKGEIEKCEQNQLGDIILNENHHSTNAWITEELFFEYLDFIRKQYSINQKIHLIVDRNTTHKGEYVIAKAKKKKISSFIIFLQCAQIFCKLKM